MEQTDELFTITARVLMACVIGGVIGFEREATHRPAGFRTHILVCVGATLAMLTGEHAIRVYGVGDPLRIGAQVISGIGFLGAGTILRSGFDVRGLTTAASLWAVSCVGLACGAGFYVGALVSGGAVYAALTLFHHITASEWQRSTFHNVIIHASNVPCAIASAQDIFSASGIEVLNTRFECRADQPSITDITFDVRYPSGGAPDLIQELRDREGIAGVRVTRASMESTCQ